MITQRPLKAQVSKKRPVHTYAELWHGSHVLLERGQAELRGSKWLWMGSLILTAFSFEAYLNHIGPKVFKCWDALEGLSSEKKLDVICEKLKINLPKDELHRKTVHELIQFRNRLAHGKTVIIEEKTICDADEYLDEFLGIRPLAIWEKYCTENNAIRARENVAKIMQLIHDEAKPENDPLFFTGIGTHSASIKE